MTDLSDVALEGLIKKTISHFQWVTDRLVNVYGESENVDFVLACKRHLSKLRETAAALRERGKLWKPRIPDCPFCGENVFDGKHVIGIPGGITCPKQGGGATAKPTDIRIGLPATPAPAGDVTVGAAMGLPVEIFAGAKPSIVEERSEFNAVARQMMGPAPDPMQAERRRIAAEVRRVYYMVRSVGIPEYDTAKIADRIESGEFARGGK